MFLCHFTFFIIVGKFEPFFNMSFMSRSVRALSKILKVRINKYGKFPSISNKATESEADVPKSFDTKSENSQNVKSLLDDAANFQERNPPEDGWSSPVYPVMTNRSQAKLSSRPNVDPTTTSVILFPGQGVQYVGMAETLLETENVKEMFECANEILRYNLLDLCLHGPKQMLDDTVHCQVAVMVASLAAVEKLKQQAPQAIENCVAAAGFSVGEYAALVFAGALTFEDGVRLLKIRGEAMQAASELCPSGMMTVMLHPDAKMKFACMAAREWCIRKGIPDPECAVAVYLYPQARVIAGNEEALKFLELNAQDFGIKKIKYLPVSGAFHTKLMRPAQKVLKNALEMTPIEIPLIPVHSNFDGKMYMNEKHIREKLCEQMCQPVKWEQIMHIIYERSKDTNFPTTYECGPARSLKTILKQNNEKAFRQCMNITA